MDRITSDDAHPYRQQTENQNINRGAVSERSLYEDTYTPQEFSPRDRGRLQDGGLSGGPVYNQSNIEILKEIYRQTDTGNKKVAPGQIQLDGSIVFHAQPKDMQPRASAQEAQPADKPHNMQTHPRAHETQPADKPRNMQPHPRAQESQPADKPRNMQPHPRAQESQPADKPRNMQPHPRAQESQPADKPRNMQPHPPSQERRPGGSEAIKDPGFLYPLYPGKEFCPPDRSELPVPKLPQPKLPQEKPDRDMNKPDIRKEMPLRQGALSW